MLYPWLIHMICIARLLQSCAEKVRSHFQDFYELIAIVKAAVKNKNRRKKFGNGNKLVLIGLFQKKPRAFASY